MAKQINLTPRRKKILEIFQPDESGFSRRVTREELETAGLVGNNGNFRREIAFDWDYFIWKIERLNPDQPTSKVIAVSMVGLREEDTFNQNIRAEIRALILESTYCNLSLMPVSHKNDKEVDHRYGYKEHPTYIKLYKKEEQKAEDFQLLHRALNLQKRQMCKTCVETKIRPSHPEKDFVEGSEKLQGDHPCRGCFLAEPERYRI
jgi:hypothetical protein